MLTKTFIALALILAVVAALHADPLRRDAQAAGASTPFVSQQLCTQLSDRVTVVFNWAPSNLGTQWLDLSLADNGFAPDTFVSAGPLGSTQSSFSWPGLVPGATHYVRVNTLTPAGWQPSPTYSFVTGVCHVPASRPILFDQHCSSAQPGRVTVTLHWTPGDAGPEWVDLSLFDNGFAPGTFIGAGPLASGASSFIWDGLLERATHFLRVNTLTSIGWRPSAVVRFTTMSCTAHQPTVTLTFDDGGPAAGAILDALDRYGVRAIFFPTGVWANAHPDLVKRMIADGDLVGDHTYSHANLTLLTPDQVRAQIAGGNVGNIALLRPPYDAFNAQVTAIANQMGFRIYLYNVDPRDWAKTYPGGDVDIENAVISHAFPGAVVDMHMEGANTALALPTIIVRLEADGYAIGW